MPAARLRDRLLWAVMLALHGYGLLVGLGGDSLSASSALGLGLANLLFLLKVLDVPWLRFQWTRRTAVIWLVAIAVAHAELIPHVDGALSNDWAPLVVMTLGGWSAPALREAVGRITQRRIHSAIRRPRAAQAAWRFNDLRADAHARLLCRFRITTTGWLDPPAVTPLA